MTSVPPAPEEDTANFDYLEIANMELRRAIISEWQQTMSTAALTTVVCAVCARDTNISSIVFVKPRKVDFALLCNPLLPDNLQPSSYNRVAYGGAILHPKGLTNIDGLGDLRICKECRSDLARPRMPRFALANWLYYGLEKLPNSVSDAFRRATPVERILVSRARASKISYKFSELPGHVMYKKPAVTSQRCVKGNIAIHPQDTTSFNEVLPPSAESIRDTVCAVFVGQTKPDLQTIRQLTPILVRKSRVRIMIEFLVAHNPHYRVGETFKGFSKSNLDNLFGPGTQGVDEDVLCSMEIGHIGRSDGVEGATSSYIPGQEDGPAKDEEGVLMENVGYTDNDDTPVNYRRMTMVALAHCLADGRFLKVQAGSKLIPDFRNPNLLSWLFPHLDPWGIGGFHKHERFTPLTMAQQLKYLLSVHDSPFRKDPDFAFVYYNILQKKAVYDSVTFRVSGHERESVVQQLLKVDVVVLNRLIAAFKENPHYKCKNAEESSILKLLLKVNAVSHDLPGSNGYKIALRNQIRGLINDEGTPTLFITLNPSDRDHPLVRLYAGDEIVLEDAMQGEELSRWKRTIYAAENPAACAKFFDTMMTNFISTVLRYGRSGRGLFG
ncbi:hypothetical protein C2E23DRAFT_736065, partial [Lenzites betulinus]